VRVDLDWI